MPIVAICPYCRAGGVRAPDSAVGSSATCPSCRSSFTVVPSDQPVPEPTKAPPPPPSGMTSMRPSAPAKPTVTETLEHSSPIDRTEPSPILPPEPAHRSGYEPDREPAEPIDAGFALALVGAALFGFGMTAALLLPYGRVIGVVVCGLGTAAGVLSLGAEGRARLVAGVAAGLNGVAILLMLLLPTWLGLQTWETVDEDEVPTGPVAVSLKTGVAMPVGEWVKSEQAAWRANGRRLTVRSATVGPVELLGPEGAKRRSREPVLLLTVRVNNDGMSRVELSGWLTGAVDEVGLTDPAGKRLKPKTFDGGWVPADGPLPVGAGLGTGKELTVSFAFEPPTARAEYLRLTLPGSAVSLTETATFRIPGPFGPPAPKRLP